MVKLNETQEDLDAIRTILLQWREEGIEKPLLPMEVDVDGDGVVDSFGLDVFGNVVIVSSTKLEDTVYVAVGDDEEVEDNG